MTLKDLANVTSDFVSVEDVARLLKKDPQVLRNDIRSGRSNIQAIVSGSRIYIPTEPLKRQLGIN